MGNDLENRWNGCREIWRDLQKCRQETMMTGVVAMGIELD